MIIPSGFVYWVADSALVMGGGGLVPDGVKTWPASEMTASRERLLRFMNEAIAEGLDRDCVGRVLNERVAALPSH